VVCSQPQFGRLWCLFTRATLLTTFSISIVTIPRCLIQLAPPCNSTSLFWSLQYSKPPPRSFRVCVYRCLSPTICRRVRRSTGSSIDSLVSTSTWMGPFSWPKSKSSSLDQIMGVYGIPCLCQSFLMIMISFVILLIQVSFPVNTPCTWVSNTLIVFFVLYPYFLWLHEAPGGTTYNFIIGTVCWKIKPTLWPGGNFRNFLEFLFSIYYSKSNQCATGFLWHCVQASFAI